MRHTFIRSALLAAAAALALTSCSVTSHTEIAEGINFNKYKTFSWANDSHVTKADRADNDIIDNNIKNAVSEELVKKGWTESGNNPDVLLDYTVAVKKVSKLESDPVYGYPYTPYLYGHRGIYSIWYPSALMGYRSYNVPFKEGELTVNMVDEKTNKLIWQGWAKGEISSKTVTSKEVSARVKSIFKKFEYPG